MIDSNQEGTGGAESTRLRGLPFMDLYVRLDPKGRGEARYRSPARDYSNNWSRPLPDLYRAEVEAMATLLAEDGARADSAFSYDGMRFRRSVQKMGNGQLWVTLRRINARVPMLEEMSVSEQLMAQLRRFGQRDGLILISGPTGHGKTTMGFSLLSDYLHRLGGVGITVEDPVEYDLDGPVGEYGYCYQVEVEDEDGWVEALKRALRWTPRYLFVGEVRSPRAAEQILRAATTGHLVITTIHAGSIEESIMGLLHLASQCVGDAAPYMLAQGLTAAWHQTLTETGPYLRYVFTEENNNGDPVRALIRENKVGMINSYIDKQIARVGAQRGVDPITGKRT
ncbi:MAG: ATPase, T2SS/T4P/T4SS family [Alphaproteobacteria bacterium]|nr:ATPase, T2SS/T4P/T4SS family [Alphaproteobacteria bacterium]